MPDNERDRELRVSRSEMIWVRCPVGGETSTRAEQSSGTRSSLTWSSEVCSKNFNH